MSEPVDEILRALAGVFQQHPTENGVVVLVQRPPWERDSGEWTPRWLNQSDIYQVCLIVERQGLPVKRRKIRLKIHALAAETC